MLLSVHPHWADLILSGDKRIEFRRTPPRREVATVVLYSTQPVGQIVGYFDVKGVHVGSPTSVWERFGDSGAVPRRFFREYFRDRRQAVAIEVSRAARLREPLSIDVVGCEIPPQSFQYLTPRQAAQVLDAPVLAA